jgi:hypothetical protein
MELRVLADGSVKGILSDDASMSMLRAVGYVRVSRASHVEVGADGMWWADCSPVGGPVFGPFDNRAQALACESLWLARNWL